VRVGGFVGTFGIPTLIHSLFQITKGGSPAAASQGARNTFCDTHCVGSFAAGALLFRRSQVLRSLLFSLCRVQCEPLIQQAARELDEERARNSALAAVCPPRHTFVVVRGNRGGSMLACGRTRYLRR